MAEEMTGAMRVDSCNVAAEACARARAPRGIPWTFALLAWYAFIQVMLSLSCPPLIEPIVTHYWWMRLAVPSLTMLFLAALMPMYLRRDGLSEVDLGFTSKLRRRDLIWGVAVGLAIYLIHNNLLDLVQRLTGGALINVGLLSTAKRYQPSSWFEIAGVAYGSCLMAAIKEETFDRACLITALELRWGAGPRKAFLYAGLSGFLFASTHQLGHPLYYGCYFLTGTLLAYAYILSRSLNAVILAHVVINGILTFRAFHG